MSEIFRMGGPLFMAILTVILLIVLVFAFFNLFLILRKDYKDLAKLRERLRYLKSIGLFALVTGFLGQVIGLLAAFSAIEKAGNVSPEIMAGGLKVSMITTTYGLVIFLVAYLLWFLTDFLASRNR